MLGGRDIERLDMPSDQPIDFCSDKHRHFLCNNEKFSNRPIIRYKYLRRQNNSTVNFHSCCVARRMGPYFLMTYGIVKIPYNLTKLA